MKVSTIITIMVLFLLNFTIAAAVYNSYTVSYTGDLTSKVVLPLGGLGGGTEYIFQLNNATTIDCFTNGFISVMTGNGIINATNIQVGQHIKIAESCGIIEVV